MLSKAYAYSIRPWRENELFREGYNDSDPWEFQEGDENEI